MKTKVSDEKWEAAQRIELDIWMKELTTATNDRSSYYINAFDNYSGIPIRPYEKTLEMGCGPFTQARAISNFRQLRDVTLVDPLLERYIHHPNCSYRDVPPDGIVHELITAKGEDFCRNDTFDLGIMINVLPHCQDAGRVILNLLSSVKPGGVVVIGEPTHHGTTVGSGAHPVIVTMPWLTEKLSKVYPIFQTDIDRGHYVDHILVGLMP